LTPAVAADGAEPWFPYVLGWWRRGCEFWVGS
jgi:hypothetical protein